jgi:hypothetical protein
MLSMVRILIPAGNWAFLALVLIGVPAITSVHFGGVQLSSVQKARFLTLGGLAFAAIANLIVRFLSSNPKTRTLCGRWVMVHTLFLAVQVSYFRGVIQFQWLKDLLQVIQQWLTAPR